MDKSVLTGDRVTARTAEVEVEGAGTITVRALSRAEMIEAQKHESNPLRQERYILSCAMVDPAMREDDVAAWQKASPAGEINAVAMVVNELSGIGPNAAKLAYKSNGDRSES